MSDAASSGFKSDGLQRADNTSGIPAAKKRISPRKADCWTLRSFSRECLKIALTESGICTPSRDVLGRRRFQHSQE